MTEAIQYLIDAIAFGSLFALMALGLALLFNVMGLMNFAYGELIMAAAYTMYYTRDFGWVPMVLITIVVVIIVSVLLELVAFRPVRNTSPVTLLVTSFAVSYGLQQLAWMTVGRGPQKGVEPYPWLTVQMEIGGVRISRLAILTMCVAVVLFVGMSLMLKRTALGIQLRASTEDFRMAQLVGVRANWVISSAFAITGFLAAVVGILYVLRTGAIDPGDRARPAARRLRRRRDRWPGQPRGRGDRRVRARRHHQRAPGLAADPICQPHADVRVHRRHRHPRAGAERARGYPRRRLQARMAAFPP